MAVPENPELEQQMFGDGDAPRGREGVIYRAIQANHPAPATAAGGVELTQADRDLVKALAALRKEDGFAAAEIVVARHRLSALTPPLATPPGCTLVVSEADEHCGCPEEEWDTPWGYLFVHLNDGKPTDVCLDLGDHGQLEATLTASTVDEARKAAFAWASIANMLTPAASVPSQDDVSALREAARPSDEDLDPHLPERVKAERRLGIQRSDWLTGCYVPWSPRNDNNNSEGPWSHWVTLAHEILAFDTKARTALALDPKHKGADK